MWLGVAITALTPFDDVRPSLIGVQWSPLSVERKTPLPKSVPAKRSPLALVVSERTNGSVRPVFASSQWSPLSLDRKTPPLHVPAKTSPVGLTASAATSVFARLSSTSHPESRSSVGRRTP